MNSKARLIITTILDLFFAAFSFQLCRYRFPLDGTKDYVIALIWALFLLYFIYSAVRKIIWLVRNM